MNYKFSSEKYSRGWRGAPAKGVGRLRGARVQIPLSPFAKWQNEKNLKKYLKNCLTNENEHDRIKLVAARKTSEEHW